MSERSGQDREGAGRPVNPQEIHSRIENLRGRVVLPTCDPEDLARPVEEVIRVDAEGQRSKLTLVEGGEDVSWATVVDLEQQIGRDTICLGGIAGVNTPEKHRFRGHSRRVLENALRWMRQNGFQASMLYGIPSYYPKFGYIGAFPRPTISVKVRDAETVGRVGHPVVPFQAEEHLEAVLEMYHCVNRNRTGVTRRDPDTWDPFRKGRRWNSGAIVKVAVDADGSPAGYIVFDDAHFTATVIEVGCSAGTVCGDLLRVAADYAWEQRLETIDFLLPEDHAFVEYLKEIGFRKTVVAARDGGPMVRMLNIPEALGRICRELASRMPAYPGDLTIRTNLDDVTVAWNQEGVRVCDARPASLTATMPQWALAQLFYGVRTPDSLAAHGHVTASAQALAALRQFFPVRPHFHYPVDAF